MYYNNVKFATPPTDAPRMTWVWRCEYVVLLHLGVSDACAGAALGLEMRFAPTYSLLCLHVWLALVRLRAEGADGRDMAQMMYEDFQEDVERRVRAEGVKVLLPIEAYPDGRP